MAGKVFFSVTMSLDGFIALEHVDEPDVQRWMTHLDLRSPGAVAVRT